MKAAETVAEVKAKLENLPAEMQGLPDLTRDKACYLLRYIMDDLEELITILEGKNVHV